MLHNAERALGSPIGRQVTIDGQRFKNFSGCSYLDLSGHPEVVRAAAGAAETFGLGGDLGYSIVGDPIYEIERSGADFLGFEASLFCTSAYVGVLIMAQHYRTAVRRAYIDASSHYSIRHGLALAGIEAIEFKHCDAGDLHAQVQTCANPSEKILVMTDGVFPTWGDIAPLHAYGEALRGRDAIVLVDDAHGTGVLGATGAGVMEHCRVEHKEQWVLVTSFSKALGCQGSLIGMSRADHARVKASNVIYNSVSLPSMPTTAAAHRAMTLAQDPAIRSTLRQAVARLRDGLAAQGIPTTDNAVPIITFTLGTAAANQQLFSALYEQGYLVTLSNYVGSPDEGAIRITLMASNTAADVDDLLAAIAGCRFL
jgi:7-keto-8-aminopelargonate synthetase-like enzyme